MMEGKCYHKNGPHPDIPVWKCEFDEDFEVPDVLYNALDLLWFKDESWHNDVCPHFTCEISAAWILELWVQHPLKERREIPAARYQLYLTYKRGEVGEDSLLILASEYAGEVLPMITTIIESSKRG